MADDFWWDALSAPGAPRAVARASRVGARRMRGARRGGSRARARERASRHPSCARPRTRAARTSAISSPPPVSAASPSARTRWNHPNLARLDDAALAAELELAARVAARAIHECASGDLVSVRALVAESGERARMTRATPRAFASRADGSRRGDDESVRAAAARRAIGTLVGRLRAADGRRARAMTRRDDPARDTMQ